MSSEKPRPLVVSGPSGSGKSTLLNRLFAEFPETFGFSVSHTTRPPRPGEEDGKQYHFMDRENFQKMVDEGKFIEHAEFGGNLYGTSVEAIKAVAKATKIAVLDVDMQGVKSVKNTDLNARFVFIKPPSVDVLEQRLRERGTETEQAIKDRLAMATAELEYAAQPGTHDLVIVNESLDDAYKQLKEYVVGITGALPAAAAAADGNKSAAADENKSAAADENKNAAADESKSAAADQPPTEPGGLAIAGPQPGASASPSSASAASPAPADAPKSGKKSQDKKEKEAAEKAKKEKAKEEKAAIKAKEKEEKAKKSKGGAKGKGPASPTADTGAEAGAAGGSDAAAPSAAGKKSKTCTIL